MFPENRTNVNSNITQNSLDSEHFIFLRIIYRKKIRLKKAQNKTIARINLFKLCDAHA